MTFEKEILETQKELVKLGHIVEMPYFTEKLIGKDAHDELKFEKDLIKHYFKEIKKSDAALILNLEKNEIKNYIGGNTFLEMSFAYVLEKKIFLYNPIPKMSYTSEIQAMRPIIINGDLSKIK